MIPWGVPWVGDCCQMLGTIAVPPLIASPTPVHLRCLCTESITGFLDVVDGTVQFVGHLAVMPQIILSPLR